MPSTLRWGVIGTGMIAGKFAADLKNAEHGALQAVGSRSEASAKKFADKHGPATVHGSYEALLADDSVDAVYIALPNHLHARWCFFAAEAGKHILCEKPLAMNAPEAERIIEKADYHDVFFMEAFMYRCHPQIARVVDLLREGAIGQLRAIHAAFAFNAAGAGADHRLINNEMGGGAIMDVGCYALSAARLLAGATNGQDLAEPIDLKAVGELHPETGVDRYTTATAKFAGGIVATLTTSVQGFNDKRLVLIGDNGRIELPEPWTPRGATEIHVTRGKETETLRIDAPAELYALEADTVARCIDQRQADPPAMTWCDSLGQARAIDDWRKQVGVVYPTDTAKGLSVATITGRPLEPREPVKMQYGQVAGVDKPVSRIVSGSTQFNVDKNLPFTFAALDHFIELGGTTIDTAYVYGGGRCSKAVGEWLAGRNIRDRIVLIGKGAHTPHCDPESLTRQLHETLDRLKTDHLDIYFMHRDNPEIPVGEFVDVMDEHRRAGRMSAFGGSNWTFDRIREANEYAAANGKAGFSAISNNLALAVWNEPMWADCVHVNTPEWRQYLSENNMANFAWSAMASGFHAAGFTPEQANDPAIREVVRVWFNDDNFERQRRATELAAKKNTSVAALTLAWVLQQPYETFALVRTHNLQEANQNMDTFDVQLTPEEIAWLNLEK